MCDVEDNSEAAEDEDDNDEADNTVCESADQEDESFSDIDEYSENDSFVDNEMVENPSTCDATDWNDCDVETSTLVMTVDCEWKE